MSGLGFQELCVIFVLVLILFGPKELPKIARHIAKLIYEMKNIFQRLEQEWNLKPAERVAEELEDSPKAHLAKTPVKTPAKDPAKNSSSD